MSLDILLVDDDAGVLRSLERLLHRHGYKVEAHSTAEEALRATRKNEYRVVISDYRMPKMNGVEFLTVLREASPLVVRMMLSGEADREAILASVNEAEIFRFLVKPWDDQELVDNVAAAIAERERIGEVDVALDLHRKKTDRDYRRKQAVAELEKESPGITDVNWSHNHTIVIDDT